MGVGSKAMVVVVINRLYNNRRTQIPVTWVLLQCGVRDAWASWVSLNVACIRKDKVLLPGLLVRVKRRRACLWFHQDDDAGYYGIAYRTREL